MNHFLGASGQNYLFPAYAVELLLGQGIFSSAYFREDYTTLTVLLVLVFRLLFLKVL